LEQQPSNALLDEVMCSMHSDYGHTLMDNWNFPNRYCTVARDHQKEEIDSKDALLMLVRMANDACHMTGVGSNVDPAVILAALSEAKALGLSDMDLTQLEIQLEDLPLH
jgi:HD-like signal output (HDOD) protein